MSKDVGFSTSSWETHFFSTPSDKSDGSFWSQTKLSQYVECLKAYHDTSSVIIGTSLASSIPWIKMPTQDENFIGVLATSYFSYQVITSGLIPLRFQFQMNNYLLSSILHSLEHFGILNWYGSSWDLRVFGVITSSTSVRVVDTETCNTSQKHSNGSIFSRSWWTTTSVSNRGSIIHPRVIK